MNQFASRRPARTFGNATGRTIEVNRRSGFNRVDGQYDSFWPRKDIAVWLYINPNQHWNYNAYDRETKEVVRIEDQFHLQYIQHFIAATKRRFQCSAEADRSKPCLGCSVRNNFYEELRAEELRTGVRRKGEAPVGAMPQYGSSIIVLENFTKTVKLNKEGKPVLGKRDNKPIMQDTPLPYLSKMEAKAAVDKGLVQFGKAMHWTVSGQGLAELLAADEGLRNICANCTGEMCAQIMVCPECTAQFDIGEAVAGEDLTSWRKEELQCAECSYAGVFLPDIQCECGKPEDGSLDRFAIRVKIVPIDEKKSKIEITDVRPVAKFLEQHPAIQELITTPLDLPKIFAATPLAEQQALLPARLLASSTAKLPSAATTGYTFNKEAPGALADDDDIPF